MKNSRIDIREGNRIDAWIKFVRGGDRRDIFAVILFGGVTEKHEWHKETFSESHTESHV